MRSANWRYGLQNRVPRFNSGRGLQKTPEKSTTLTLAARHACHWRRLRRDKSRYSPKTRSLHVHQPRRQSSLGVLA
jgi:hypothetical protein